MLLGTGWMDRVHLDDRASTRQRWAPAVAASQMLELEHRLQRADGAYRWHLTRAQPVLDTDGSVLMWVGAYLTLRRGLHMTGRKLGRS